MVQRQTLQQKLKEFTPNVYFQAPGAEDMNYPAIVYKISGSDVMNANNKKYRVTRRYLVTYIDSNPDNTVYSEIEKLPLCELEDVYEKDGLHHYIFTLYF